MDNSNSLVEVLRKNSAAALGDRTRVAQPLVRIEEEQLAERIFHACFSQGIEKENAMKRSVSYEHSQLGPSQGGVETAVRRLIAEGLEVKVSYLTIADPHDDYLSPKTPKYVYVIIASW